MATLWLGTASTRWSAWPLVVSSPVLALAKVLPASLQALELSTYRPETWMPLLLRWSWALQVVNSSGLIPCAEFIRWLLLSRKRSGFPKLSLCVFVVYLFDASGTGPIASSSFIPICYVRVDALVILVHFYVELLCILSASSSKFQTSLTSIYNLYVVVTPKEVYCLCIPGPGFTPTWAGDCYKWSGTG
jgi:hypothetical protein